MVKPSRLNSKCFAWRGIYPSLSSPSSSYRRHWGLIEKEDYQVRFQLTFLDWRRAHSMIILGVVLVLALRGARVVMAPRPAVAGGSSSSLCEGMHWLYWHHLLFNHLVLSVKHDMAHLITQWKGHTRKFMIGRNDMWILSTIITRCYFNMCL